VAKKTRKKKESPEKLSFEEALDRLEQIVQELEEGELGLEESLARYEEAVGYLKRCHGLLEKAQLRVELLTGVGQDGEAQTEPFPLDLDDEAEEAP